MIEKKQEEKENLIEIRMVEKIPEGFISI